jgi:hypothetical protein
MRRTVAALSLLLTIASCSGAQSTPTAISSNTDATPYSVVTSTSIFADLARLALGKSVSIQSIVPAGVDVHTFEPSPADAEKIRSADLIVMNGLGLDAWMAPLIEAANKSSSNTLLLGEGLDRESGWVYLQNANGGSVDPHIWLDPKGAELYVQRIADRVSTDAPELSEAIAAVRAVSIKKIEALNDALTTAFAAISPAQKKIVTLHDAFGYFARAYGIEIVGVVVESPGQDPSAQEITALIDAVRRSGVKALFSEVQFPSKVLNQISAETGATVLQNLYSDALGAPPADSYLGVMQINADAILGALR